MKVKLTKWRGKQLESLVEKEYQQRLAQAAILVENTAKQDLSSKGAKCSGVGAGEGNRSSPGSAPHLECGTLRNSVTHEVKDDIARVGSNLVYAKYLELGTSKMSARPWLRPALDKCWKGIQRIMGRKMSGL